MIGRQDLVLQELAQMMERERKFGALPPMENLPLMPVPGPFPGPEPEIGAPFNPVPETLPHNPRESDPFGEDDEESNPEIGPVNQTQRELDEIFPATPPVQRNPFVPGQRPGTGKSEAPPLPGGGGTVEEWNQERENWRTYRDRFPGSEVDFGEQQGMIENYTNQQAADRQLTPEQLNNIDRQMDYDELVDLASEGRRDLSDLNERDVPTGLSARDLDDMETLTEADKRMYSEIFSGNLDEDIQALGVPGEDDERAAQRMEMFIQLHGDEDLPDEWLELYNQRQRS